MNNTQTPVLGGICKSTQGRDKDKWYIICGIMPSNVVLVTDGKAHGRQNPKRKNLKHIHITPFICHEAAEAFGQNGNYNDCDIAYYLKQFAKSNQQNAAPCATGK
jgi:ribosomal protein L14E/L6E/L27E